MKTKGWQTLSLIELKENKKHALNGGPFGSKLVSNDYVEDGVPVIRGTNLPSDARFSFDDLVYVSEEKANELLPNNAHPGDLVFTQRGTLGQVGLIPLTSKFRRFVISQSQMKLTVDEKKADRLFLFYYFRSPKTIQRIHNISFSSGVPHINLEILRSFEVTLPPLLHQQRIASILSAYDDLIENNTRRIKILEEMAQAIYREWFVEFRAPGVELRKASAEEKKLTGKDRFPKGWEVKKLSSMVQTQYGYTESASESPIGPKYLRGMDINKTSYIQWDSVPFCPISAGDLPKYKLTVGDILVIRMADPGKIGIVEKGIDAVFASYLIRLSIQGSNLTPYYLFYFLLSDRYQGYVTGASTGTTRKSASAGVITDVDMAVPSSDAMQSFDELISTKRKLLNCLLDKNANLRRTRDLLLPKLISGEVEVTS